MEIKGIRALVTGGVSGLGLAVAERFAASGGRLALFDVNEEAADAALEKLGRDRATFFRTDVTDENQVADNVAAANRFLGGLDAAVSCAGVLGAGRVLGRNGPMPLEKFATTVMVNLVGSFNVAKAAADAMQRNDPNADGERGVIINTASVAAWEGQIGQAAYSASKSGVVGMTLPMAREFTRFGIRVNTIAPGVFHTPMVDTMPEEVQQALGDSVPFPNRLGRPEEFAALAVQLIENAYFNGATIRLDGAIRLQPK
jgi:NAD(P)-dependent dehydrogenase (short-subunit alcohol dehydrogenase family)